GASLAARERYAEAEPLLHDAHATLRRTRSPDDPYTRQTLRHLVQFYDDWGRTDQAAAWRDSLAIAK
ncbi:MAG: tetratricopeptide repeat protein, partial [Bacteroidetes bacterium]|nr:tetratricopeptide repeat protein [Bacteroidota bacterium]